MTQAALSGERIVCLALLPWRGPWKAYHQLVSRLAAANRVLCVDPPLSLRTAVDAIRSHEPRGPILERGGPQLFLYRAPRLLAVTPHCEPFSRVTEQLRLAQARRLARRHGFDAPILWVFNPMLADAVGTFGERLVVYHVVDNYVEYAPPEAAALRAAISRNEQIMLARADVVFTVSPSLQARCGATNPRCYLVPNGVDVERFEAARDARRVPADLRPIARPIIGHVGAIQPTVDLALLRRVAAAHRDWSLVLVGPNELGEDQAEFNALLRLPNVHYLGLKPVEDVPYYISACDVGLIADVADDRSADIDSLKLYEYLACGRPVVSTDIPAAHRFGEGIRIAADPAEFVDHIAQALRNEDDAGTIRQITSIAAHSWQRRVDTIGSVVREHLAAQAAGVGVGLPARETGGLRA